jgi:hypothetical protein
MPATARKVWHDGLAPQLSTPALQALAAGLRTDDKAIIQNATTIPPPLEAIADEPVERVCPLCYALLHGYRLVTIRQVEERFARLCQTAGEALGEYGAVRWLLNWIDETDRATMRRLLLVEVNRTLASRPNATSAA